MKHYLIRFNTKAAPGDPLIWRVIEDGEEWLASDVEIFTHVYTQKSVTGDEVKWNMACDGFATWSGSKVEIW